VKKRAWFALCALVGAGCIRSDAAMTEERFCQEYARIECGKVSSFCSFNPATCQSIREATCRESAGRLKGGGHQFNPGNTDPCLKKLEEAYKVPFISAALLKGVDDTCIRVFEGTAKANEPCAADYDCAGGLICDKGHCGTLKVVASLSGCANIGERCQPGEFCTNDTPGMLFMCVRRLGQGAPCSLSRPCADGLRCQDTCVPKLDTQGTCTTDEDCQSGYCNRYVDKRTCGLGLTFSPESPSCVAYMSVPDGGTPMRGTNEVSDAGTD
jgi:hypothetical protein